MNLFSAHIAGLRISTGLSQKQLAQMIGTGITTIKNIESGYLTAPSPLLVEKLAKVFGTDPFSLLNRTSLPVAERGKMVHIVSDISGSKPFLETAKIVETVFIERDKYYGYEYMGVKMQDNSMIDAHICPGDSVIIRQDAVVKNGDLVVAVCNDTNGIVRRYFRTGDTVLLKAENNSGLYPEIKLDLNKERFVLMGKVIKWIHSSED